MCRTPPNAEDFEQGAHIRALLLHATRRLRKLEAHSTDRSGCVPHSMTLLPVDPYLVHVYWDFDLAKLPPDTAAAVLRFYD